MPDTPDGVIIRTYERLVGEWPTRFHLRIDPDGHGLLLANAAEAAYLSPVGVRMVRGILDGLEDSEIVEKITVEWDAPESQVRADLATVHQLISDLSEPGDNYPITNLGDSSVTEWERELSAPLRADIEQAAPELFRPMVQTLWAEGVPHVCIQTREDSVASQLMLLVEAAEDLGMICGIRAVAGWIGPDVIEACAMAGLDHLDLLYVSHDAQAHDGICGDGDHAAFVAAVEQCRDLELALVAQVPLTDMSLLDLDETMLSLHELGVTNIVGFAIACPDEDDAADASGALPARAIPQVATTFIELAESRQARYLWAPPVRFDSARGIADQVIAGPRTSGDVTIRVRSDGTVLPARGSEAAGNILRDPWRSIWQHEAFTRYRERLKAPTRCADCPDLPICSVDCPKDPAGWSDDRRESEAQ